MTHNLKLLARLVAHHAVQKASRPDVRPPQERVMEALSEAIASKRDEVQALVQSGRSETDACRAVNAQLTKWTEVWNSNR